MIVTKVQLVRAVMADTGLTKEQASNAVNSVISNILSAIAAKDTVSLVGFGTFKADHKEAHQARNPSTGGLVNIPEHYKPKFSFAESVRLSFRDGDTDKYLKETN